MNIEILNTLMGNLSLGDLPKELYDNLVAQARSTSTDSSYTEWCIKGNRSILGLIPLDETIEGDKWWLDLLMGMIFPENN